MNDSLQASDSKNASDKTVQSMTMVSVQTTTVAPSQEEDEKDRDGDDGDDSSFQPTQNSRLDDEQRQVVDLQGLPYEQFMQKL